VQKRLEAVIPDDTEILVFDTPARPSAWLRQVLLIADVVLVVVTPDAASYATLPATEALLEEYRPGAEGRRRAHYLVNRFDARRALDRDMLASLRGMMPDRALARPIHSDGIVADALARRKFVVQEGPDSQVVSELSSLAVWIEAHTAEARVVAAQPLAAVAAR
jgi:cellulose synthase operon protein YhjQ